MTKITWTLYDGRDDYWHAFIGDVLVGWVMQYQGETSCHWVANIWGSTWRRKPRRQLKMSGDAKTVNAGKKLVEQKTAQWFAEAGLAPATEKAVVPATQPVAVAPVQLLLTDQRPFAVRSMERLYRQFIVSAIEKGLWELPTGKTVDDVLASTTWHDPRPWRYPA